MKINFLRHSLRFCLTTSLLCYYSCQDEVLQISSEPEVEKENELSDAYHDNIRTKPYPKADNELYLNPPPLIVPKDSMTGERILFALSQNENFTTSETELSESKAWCIFNPHRKLSSGTWYWRFRQATDENKPQGEWSKTYSFEVKDKTPVFVTPSFSEFYNNAPHHYPRLYCFLDPYLEEARVNYTSKPEFRYLKERVKSAMEVDYTNVNPHEQASDLTTHLQALYDIYHLSQQPIYIERMHQLLKQLLAAPLSDGLFFASNFGATDIGLCYAYLYDQLYNIMTAAERTAIEKILLRLLYHYSFKQMGNEENHIFDNHFWQQNIRVLFECAFLLYDHPEYAPEVMPVMEYYYELWTARAPASGFNRDGIWHNGSGYFNNNIKTLFYMPMLFSYITRKDFLQHPWYLNAGKSLVYTFPPRSKSNGFGDGSEKDKQPSRMRVGFADFLARELNDSYAGWYAQECISVLPEDFELRLYRLCSPRSYDTNLPADAPKMIWYKDAGEVTMHSNVAYPENDINLSFRSSIFGSGSHTTSSQNAFNLLYKGAEVYRSSGYYLNFSDAHNLMSYRHTRAHNSILVNGIGQPFSIKAYGNIMRALEGEHITYCLGDASKAYYGISEYPMWVKNFKNAGIEQTPEYGFGETPLTKYRRHMLMLHPEGYILIYDELESSQPVTYDWLLHSPSQMYFNQELLTVSHKNERAKFTAVTQLFCNDPVSMSITNKFVVPPTLVYDPAYPNQWHTTAQIEGVAKTRILAIIQLNSSESYPIIIKQNDKNLVIGNWSIEAQLNTSHPSKLTVTHAFDPVFFSLGKENPIINGKEYLRKYAGSSMLYDEDPITGKYTINEMKDQQPASTRGIR